MTQSPKTGRELEEQRVRNGPSIFAKVVRGLSSNRDDTEDR